MIPPANNMPDTAENIIQTANLTIVIISNKHDKTNINR